MKNYFNLLISLIMVLTSIPAFPQTSAVGGQSMVQNYTLNGGFENSTHGWKTYKNTAGVAPLTGTGGSPSVTLTTSLSNPLAGKSSGVFSHPASNVQGEGISYDFSIEQGAKGRVISITGVYQVASGTYSGGTSSTDSDVEMYIYDKDAGVIMQAIPYKLDGGVAGINYAISASFQPLVNTSLNYRLIFHSATTTATAYSLKFDSIIVSLQQRTNSPMISDWAPYSCTSNMTTNTTVTCQYRRVGGNLEGKAQLSFAGAPNNPAADITVSLPAGLQIDASKLTLINGGNLTTLPGSGIHSCTNGGNGYHVMPYYQGTTTGTTKIGIGELVYNTVYSGTTYPADSGPTPTTPCTIASGGGTSVNWSVPIIGWASSSLSSDQGDARPVIFSVNQALPTATVTSTLSLAKFTGGVLYDTHGAFSTTTGLYTCPVAGWYRATVNLAITNSAGAGSNAQLAVAKNGSSSTVLPAVVAQVYQLAGAQTLFPFGSFVTYCNAGDTLAPYVGVSTASSAAIQNNIGVNAFTVEKINGQQQMTAADAVRTRASSTSLSISTTMTLLKPATINFDVSGSYSASTGLFTCPTAGIYQVNARVFTGAIALNTGGNCGLAIFKNNAYFGTVALVRGTTASSQSYMLNGTDLVSCNATETLGIGAYCDVANTATQIDAYYFRTGN